MKTVSKFNIFSYVIDFRPLVSNDPAHHRAFINSIEEHKLPKVDFGF